ncbi:TPA: hypothetical protein N0F65_001469 [Lagenidium giganteum]|uniref:Uncharacterized protein n=1 Tax=Lagenidium giganteum TaxID=4803 RepID=A0AAV2YJM5_9STRA|nr:TPA: hypothetical protein N0F65_001469 [Lagenidium giganteum]
MFPNFRSLQDKRNKWQQLLQQIEREQELERIKNEAYALTDWTSDQAKMMAVSQIPSTATASTQTNTNTMSGSTQTDNNTSSGSTQTNDSMAYTNAGAQTNDSMSQANVTTQTSKSALVSTAAQTDESGDVKQPIVEPRIKVEPGIHDEQAAAKDEIEYIYGKLPQLTDKKISPLKSNGMPDKDTFIGAEGEIYNRRTGKPSRKADYSFDFSQTLSYLKNLQDILDIKDEPMELANKDTSTNLPDGAIEADAKDLLKQILQTNELSRFKVVPIGKLKHPKTNEYWEYPNYHVDKDLNIVSDAFGKKNYNSKTSKISWAHTLSNFVSILKKNNVSFKQSNLFTGVKNKWDSPLALNDLSASLNNANNKASQHNGATYLKIELSSYTMTMIGL